MAPSFALRSLVALTVALLSAPDVPRADECEDASTQVAINECSDRALKQADGELNALYGQVQARLKSDPDKAKLLTMAQRSWISFRDSECKFAASGVSGGSVYGSVVADCRTQQTKLRINDLKGYLKCAEGDVSCPVPND